VDNINRAIQWIVSTELSTGAGKPFKKPPVWAPAVQSHLCPSSGAARLLSSIGPAGSCAVQCSIAGTCPKLTAALKPAGTAGDWQPCRPTLQGCRFCGFCHNWHQRKRGITTLLKRQQQRTATQLTGLNYIAKVTAHYGANVPTACSPALHCQPCTAIHCPALPCSAVQCTALHCTGSDPPAGAGRRVRKGV
jgi:hypothetical protein